MKRITADSTKKKQLLPKEDCQKEWDKIKAESDNYQPLFKELNKLYSTERRY